MAYFLGKSNFTFVIQNRIDQRVDLTGIIHQSKALTRVSGQALGGKLGQVSKDAI